MAKNINIVKPGEKTQTSVSATNVTKPESGKLVDLNFKVPAEFKREFKQLALDLELNQKQILEKAVQLLKQALNSESAK